MTKTERLLRWMEADKNGKTLCEIQSFLLIMDPRTRKTHVDIATGKRLLRYRGWWGTNLYENCHWGVTGRMGILLKYCRKINGRWVVTEPLVGPWYRPVETKSYKANMRRQNAEHRARVAKLPKCKYCNRPYKKTAGWLRTPDNACITTSSADGYIIDCIDNVFYTIEYRHTDLSMDTLTDLTRSQLNNALALIGRDDSIDYEVGRKMRQDFVKSHII